MSKAMMKNLMIGLLALVGVVAIGVFVFQGEEEPLENEVIGMPPSLIIDSGYNATLSGTPFYTVLEDDEDLFDDGLATCSAIGDEDDRQSGWYTLAAIEDGKTAREVVFEQAELEEGDNIVAVYYNPVDKTFESMPNRIIKNADGSDLLLLDWDRTLQKGEVIIVNSDRSVDFCKNYDAASDHGNVEVGSWNLVSKPDFDDVGFRSIWNVDFSGDNLQQLFREGDANFDTDALDSNDLYWIYGGNQGSDNSNGSDGGTDNGGDNGGDSQNPNNSRFSVERLFGSRFQDGAIAETILYGEVADSDVSVDDEIELFCDNVAVTGTVTRIIPGDITQNTNLPNAQSASVGDKVTIFVSGVAPDQIDCNIPGRTTGNDGGDSGSDSESDGGTDNGNGVDFDDDNLTTEIPVVAITDIFTVSGRGTIVQGEVLSGTVVAGEPVTIQCESYIGEFEVRDVRTSSQETVGEVGDEVGITLPASAADEIDCFKSDDTGNGSDAGSDSDEPLQLSVQVQGSNRVTPMTFEFERVIANEIGTGFYGVDQNGLIYENFSQGDQVFRALKNMTFIGQACAAPAEGPRTTPCKPDYARDSADVFVASTSISGQDYSLISWVGRDNKLYRFRQPKEGIANGNFETYRAVSNVKDAKMTVDSKELFVTFDCTTGNVARAGGIFSEDTPYRASTCNLLSLAGSDTFNEEGFVYMAKPFNVIRHNGNRLFVGANRNQVWMTDSIDGTSYKFENVRTSAQNQRNITVNSSSGNSTRGLSSMFYANQYMFGIGRNNRLYSYDLIDEEWDIVTAGSDNYEMRSVTNLGGGIVVADGGVNNGNITDFAFSVGCFSAGDVCTRSDERARGRYIAGRSVVGPVSIDNVSYYSYVDSKDVVSRFIGAQDQINTLERLNQTFTTPEAIQYVRSQNDIYLYLKDDGNFYLYKIQQ